MLTKAPSHMSADTATLHTIPHHYPMLTAPTPGPSPAGSFFTSDRAEPQEFNGRQLYFRGRYVHQAIVSDLLDNR